MTDIRHANIVRIEPASWASGGLRVAVLDVDIPGPPARPLALRIPKGARGYAPGRTVRYRVEDGVELERSTLGGQRIESVHVPGTSYYMEGPT